MKTMKLKYRPYFPILYVKIAHDIIYFKLGLKLLLLLPCLNRSLIMLVILNFLSTSFLTIVVCKILIVSVNSSSL